MTVIQLLLISFGSVVRKILALEATESHTQLQNASPGPAQSTAETGNGPGR